MHLVERVALLDGVAEVAEAVGIGRDQALGDQIVVELRRRRGLAGLEAADAFAERLLEGAADRHHFADRLHLRAEHRLGAGELLELPARDLDHDVVDGRLEAGGRHARDVVLDLVEAVADGQFRRDLGDREAGGLRGQRRASARRADSSR